MTMVTVGFPVLVAVGLWWASTGLILAVYGRSRRVVRAAFGGGTLLMLAAVAGLALLRNQTTTPATYLSVMCGVVIWGWQVAGYYLGVITGPRSQSTPAAPDHNRELARASVARRFLVALHFGLYHELLVVAVGVVLAALVWNAPNQWGLWMYVALWLMHASAKLNVFLGVRNFRVDLLPRQMHHLRALLGRQPSNALFPVSVTAASVAVLVLFYQGTQPALDPAQQAGYFLVATMVALGLMEHWLLVLPLPGALWGVVLYRVALPDDTSHDASPTVESAAGEAIKGSVQ